MSEIILLALILPVAFVAGFLRGLTGFGGPLILMPILVLFVAPASAAAMTILMDCVSNVGILRQAVRNASPWTVAWTVLSAWATLPVGTSVMLATDPHLVRSFIYAVIGCAAVVLLAGVRFRRRLRWYELASFGGTAGGVMGLTALGIVMVPVLFSTRCDASTSRANLIVWVFCVNLAMIGFLSFGGAMGWNEVVKGFALAPVYLAGAVLGQMYFGRVDEALFRRGVLIFLIGIALIGLLLV